MKVIIGYCDGKKVYKNGTEVEGIKVYYVEAIPQLAGRVSYGSYAAVAFFPNVRSDGRPQIRREDLISYVEAEVPVDIYFDHFGGNPVIVPVST